MAIKITQKNISTAEELIRKVNEKLLENEIVDIEKTEEINIIRKINKPSEVKSKIMSAMRNIRFPPNPRHRLDLSSIPKTYIDEDGKDVSVDKFEPDLNESNLPSVISKEIMASGVCEVKWTSVSDLPGYADRDIREMGNFIFRAFDLDKNSDIMTISSFKKDKLLNEPREMNAVLGFLEKNAVSTSLGSSVQDFGETIEGYKPEIKVYHTKEMAYLVVSEGEGMGIEGNYIYAYKRKKQPKLRNEINKKIENKKRKKENSFKI